jgi:hypothetical protein
MRIASSKAQGAKTVGVGGIFRCLEAHLHVALRREVVDFIGLVLLDQAHQIGCVRQVAIVKKKVGLGLVRIDVESSMRWVLRTRSAA